MELIKQYFGVLELYKWFITKSVIWVLKNKYYGKMFVLGAFFENVFCPKGWPMKSQKLKT